MSRFEFGGYGEPIPEIGIPDPHISDNLPTQVLELIDGVPFEKADWVALGYNHYEVWCVGAAGGWGGGIFEDVTWPSAIGQAVAPTAIWNAYLAQMAASDAYLGKNFYTDYYTTIFSSVPLSFPAGYLSVAGPGSGYTGGYAYDVTHYQATVYYNPTHLLSTTTYFAPYFIQSATAWGGAGGGGGLHVVSGSLDDLPDAVDVVVGQVGADAPIGQIKSSALWTPPHPAIYGTPDAVSTWATRYPSSVPGYLPPQAGSDGGTSSFGNTICRASGGKGGHPATVWSGGILYVDGQGGDGGVGGRTAAGGGAAGGVPEPAVYTPGTLRNGQDGTWDGAIGQGGGGGRGGTYVPDPGLIYGPGGGGSLGAV